MSLRVKTLLSPLLYHPIICNLLYYKFPAP